MKIVNPALLATALLPALLGPAGCDRRAAGPAANPPGVGAAPPAAERVTVGKPVRKTLILSTSQPGRIDAFEEAPIFAKIAGYVEEVGVDIGDPVKKNQTLLIKLAVPEMNDDVKQKEALVAQAEAELKQAEVAIAGAKAAVVSAEAKVEQAEAGIGRTAGEQKRWKAEYERIKALAASKAVTDKLVDETLNQLRSAEAAEKETASSVRSAQASVAESRINVDKANADQVAADARLKVAKANLARTATLLGYTEIKAPFDGVVTRRNVDRGHFVSPPGAASTPLLVVSQTDVVRVFVDIPELEAEWVGTGDAAVVRVQALGGRALDAKVTRTAWSLDASNRSLRAEIDVKNPEGVLRPGMFATVSITLEQRPDVLTVPAAAVVRDGSDAFCYRVDGGKVERKQVELGLRSGAEVEVRSGLDAEQSIVLAPNASLKPGQPVEIITPEKK